MGGYDVEKKEAGCAVLRMMIRGGLDRNQEETQRLDR